MPLDHQVFGLGLGPPNFRAVLLVTTPVEGLVGGTQYMFESGGQ
jgi:hypothetical protein